MWNGLLFLNNGYQDMYLPIFYGDREFVLSVLTDAMKRWCDNETNSQTWFATDFYEIANNVGRERMNGFFIGPEAVSAPNLDGVEDAATRGLYIFAVNFKEKRIVTLK